MKKQHLPTLITAAAAVVAFALRLLQNLTGFDELGLPVAGNFAAIALPVFLIAAAAALFLLSRRLPQGEAPRFPADFSTDNAALLTLPIMGIFLMLASGVLGAAAIFLPDVIPSADGVSQSMQLIFAATAILPAVTLLPAAAACRKKQDAPDKEFDGTLLLAAPVCLVVRLVLTYRIYSVDPSLTAYYVELLALVLMALAFYRLASCAFDAGRTDRVSFCCGAAVMLCAAALADGGDLSSLLLYAGGALALLGFQLLHTSRPQA